jgi:hypothetical protein
MLMMMTMKIDAEALKTIVPSPVCGGDGGDLGGGGAAGLAVAAMECVLSPLAPHFFI